MQYSDEAPRKAQGRDVTDARDRRQLEGATPARQQTWGRRLHTAQGLFSCSPGTCPWDGGPGGKLKPWEIFSLTKPELQEQLTLAVIPCDRETKMVTEQSKSSRERPWPKACLSSEEEGPGSRRQDAPLLEKASVGLGQRKPPSPLKQQFQETPWMFCLLYSHSQTQWVPRVW